MKFFNYMESFFFVSLAIVFTFIIMLVYHFKQRMQNIEQKSDRMFDIINNIVKELTNIKKTQENRNEIIIHKTNENILEEKVVSEENEDEDDIDENTDVNEDFNEEDEVADDENEENMEEDNEKNNNDEEEEENGLDELIENNELDDDNDEKQFLNETSEEMKEDDNVKKINIIENLEINENVSEEKIEIHINKLQETIDFIEEDLKDDKDTYKKMNLHQLKALVISKGLATDVSKMKKNDLIKLLELNV